VIPIGFYWNGNQIVVCTATTAPKVKELPFAALQQLCAPGLGGLEQLPEP
jgi:hypothetical protein